MSDITKILLRIIMMQVRNKIKPEIAEEHCAWEMYRNAIHTLEV